MGRDACGRFEGGCAYFANDAVNTIVGVNIPWLWFATGGILVIAVLCHFHISLTAAILSVLYQAAREIYRRLMDAVDPALTDRAFSEKHPERPHDAAAASVSLRGNSAPGIAPNERRSLRMETR